MTDYNNQIRTAGSTLFNTEVSEVVGRHSLQQTSGDQQEQTPGNQQYPEPTKFGKHKALKRMGGMDVILGRGRSYHNLPGNQRFRGTYSWRTVDVSLLLDSYKDNKVE